MSFLKKTEATYTQMRTENVDLNHMRTLHPPSTLDRTLCRCVRWGRWSFLPVFVGQLAGYGTGSYEDYLFIWMATVPAGMLFTGVLAWRMMR